MANNNGNKVLNAPPLRFPEFSGEWKRSTIGEQFDLYSGNTPSRLDKNQFLGNVNWISSGELKAHYLFDTQEKITDEAAQKNNLRVLPSGTFVMAIYGLEAVGVRGTCSITTQPSTISQACMAFLPKGEINNEFLYSWYKKHGNVIGIRYAQGTKQQNLSSDIINKFHISYPSNEEAAKLEGFIKAIDERIATQIGLIEDLKKLKSAITDKVFCSPNQSKPHIRTNCYRGDWRLMRLSDFSQRVRTKNNVEHCSLVLTIAAQYGLVSQEDFFNKSVASENLDGYYLLQKGGFAYNKSYSGEYTWGAIKRLDLYEQGVLSPLYICFRVDTTKVDADFIVHYFESKKWYKGISDIAGEGARNHGLLNISVVDFFNTVHRIPCIDEQHHIATVLNSIVAKIKNEQCLLQQYNMQRQYLLRMMFV